MSGGGNRAGIQRQEERRQSLRTHDRAYHLHRKPRCLVFACSPASTLVSKYFDPLFEGPIDAYQAAISCEVMV